MWRRPFRAVRHIGQKWATCPPGMLYKASWAPQSRGARSAPHETVGPVSQKTRRALDFSPPPHPGVILGLRQRTGGSKAWTRNKINCKGHARRACCRGVTVVVSLRPRKCSEFRRKGRASLDKKASKPTGAGSVRLSSGAGRHRLRNTGGYFLTSHARMKSLIST